MGGNADGARCVELGAGPGLAGLLLAHLGANVVLTDKAPVLPIIQSNVQLNGLGGKGTVPAGKGTADVAELEWGPGECCGRTVAALAADGVDWVIAADCCYVDNELAESPSTAHFVAACAGLCGPATKCLVSFELRSQAVKDVFLREAALSFSHVARVPPSRLPKGCQVRHIELYEMWQPLPLAAGRPAA